MLTNKKRIVVAVAFVLIIATAVSISGCGMGGSPKSVVSTFFDSVDKKDANKFLSCLQKDAQDGLLEYMEKSDIKDLLTTLDESLSDMYGNSWRKKVKIGSAKKGDSEDGITYYDVSVTMEEEEDTVTVIKVKGKYYIDESSMGGFGL